MGYPRDIDEYTEEELLQELEMRRALQLEGKCDYCHGPIMRPVCKFPKRHVDKRFPAEIQEALSAMREK